MLTLKIKFTEMREKSKEAEEHVFCFPEQFSGVPSGLLGDRMVRRKDRDELICHAFLLISPKH